MCSVIVVVEFK